MALKYITPFDQASYLHEVRPFLEFVIPHVEQTPIKRRTGWLQHFLSYRYSDSTGSPTSGILDRFSLHDILLSSLESKRKLPVAASAVMKWGRIRDFTKDHVTNLSMGIENLGLIDKKGKVGNLSFGRISAFTKFYEVYAPEDWTIYDSRVASALAGLVKAYWDSLGAEEAAAYLRFPMPAGQKPRFVTGFPRGSSDAQFSLAFVYASWLLRALADSIDRNGEIGKPPSTAVSTSNWKLYHIEMALFMLGK